MATIRRDKLAELCRDALLRIGVDDRSARVLADATVEAELVGNRAVGVEHFFDYLNAYREGRIVRESRPVVHRSAPAVIDVDACGGLAQTAFVEAFDDLQEATRDAGMAALWIRNSFTCGELGYYPRRFAEQGFFALASANSPALMSLGGAPNPILGTNPLAYAIPRPGKLPVVIDQASSATAFVNIRRAAAAGEAIPAGWALGPDGEPTQDATPHFRARCCRSGAIAAATSPCWLRSWRPCPGRRSRWTQHLSTAAPPHQASVSSSSASIRPVRRLDRAAVAAVRAPA